MTVRCEYTLSCDGGCGYWFGERPEEGGEDIVADTRDEIVTEARLAGWHVNDLDAGGAALCPECWRTEPLPVLADAMHWFPVQHQADDTDPTPPHGIDRRALLDEIERAEVAGHYTEAARLMERLDP